MYLRTLLLETAHPGNYLASMIMTEEATRTSSVLRSAEHKVYSLEVRQCRIIQDVIASLVLNVNSAFLRCEEIIMIFDLQEQINTACNEVGNTKRKS